MLRKPSYDDALWRMMTSKITLQYFFKILILRAEGQGLTKTKIPLQKLSFTWVNNTLFIGK